MQNKFTALCLSLLLALPAQASVSGDPHHSKSEKKIKAVTDLRIIVDISGSMKKTDPGNLRRSAVRLLAGLIPEGSRSGIWNFGKQVNMTVKIGKVNDAWRELARKQSKKINSVGLYTNIESAMRKVSFDWKTPDPRYKRNLILLTDGHVDVSPDDKLDKASRTRILKKILPALEKAKVRIHTIALSDDVDESLLSTLSAYTDGLFKKVKSADDLQKLFLQMLEQSIALDTLPIKGNRFNVDASVNDMTLLIFNRDTAHPASIVTPGKRTWDKKQHPEQVKWFSDDGYDLVTIKTPQQGQWKIMAPVDENNRVVVATNLKLKLSNIPAYLMLGDKLNITAHLEEDGKPLTDSRLLSKFKFVLNRKAEHSSARQYPFTKSEKNEYSYEVELASIFKEGNNELVIMAKSPTVQREVRHQFKVYATPADIKISEKHGKYEIKVIPHTNLLRPGSVKIDIELNDKSKQHLIKKGDDWLLDVDAKFYNTRFTININAIRADGKPISVSFNKILSVHGKAQGLKLAVKEHKEEDKREDVHDKEKTPEKSHATKKPEKHESKDVDDKSSEKNEKVKDEMNWTVIIMSIVGGNTLLILIFAGGYLYMKRRKEKLTKSLEDEMLEDETEAKKEKEESKDDKVDE